MAVATTPSASSRSRTEISREKILDAAVRCLVEYGYAGASTLRIQELAGVSRGRLLHHFGSRDALLVGAAHHLAAERIDAQAAATPRRMRTEPGDVARIDEAVAAMWTDFRQPYFWAAVELWVAARHAPELRAVLRPTERMLARRIHTTLDALFGPVWSAHPRFCTVTEVLVASMRGAALTYAFQTRRPTRDPRLPMWCETARALLTA